MRDSWCEIYDPNYIDDTIIQGLQEKLIDLAPLLAIISEKATGKTSELVESLKEEMGENEEKKEKKVFSPTKFEPFNLTKPKIKDIPKPIVIPKKKNYKEVPETTYKTNLNKILSEKEEKKFRIKTVFFSLIKKSDYFEIGNRKKVC